MLEIIVIIAVVKAFAKLAEEKKLNKNLWGFIGAASYYLPILLMSFMILPALVVSGVIPFTDETSFMVLSVFVNLLTGILCCLIAYQVLKNKKINPETTDLDILDQDLD